jgi:hypothetical protein
LISSRGVETRRHDGCASMAWNGYSGSCRSPGGCGGAICYLIDGALFIAYLGLESLGLKSFDPGREPERLSIQSKPPAGSQGASAEVD